MISKTVAIFHVIIVIYLAIRGGGQDTSCYSCNRINSTGLNKKNIFYIFGLESGVGVKIPWLGYIDPHPLICF